MTNRLRLSLLLVLSAVAVAQTQPAKFDGVDQWKTSLTASDMASFEALYSSNPPAKYIGKDQKPAPDLTPETGFWKDLVSSGATDFDVNTVGEQDKPGFHLVSLAVAMKVKTPDGPRTRYVTEDQAWQQQSDKWRIVVVKHSDLSKMRPALQPNPHLYDKDADARAEIKEAVAEAAKNHERVILVFGANWCYDCHVLDQAFHQADVAPLLEKNFRVVHVDIGDDGKKNSDLAAEYKVPLDKGVPALAVLGPDGKLLYSQQNGEWESARSMDPDDIITFLNKWKP